MIAPGSIFSTKKFWSRTRCSPSLDRSARNTPADSPKSSQLNGSDNSFHVSDRRDLIRMAVGAVKAKRRAPVVDDQDGLAQVHGVEPGVEIAGMIDEAVGVGGRLARLPHADQVGRKTPSDVADVRNDVPPEVRGRRIAVQEDDGIAFAYIDIAHLGVEDGDTLSWMWIGGGHVLPSVKRFR